MNADVGLVGVVTLPPVPLRMLHAPVPMEGAFPARVAEEPQSVWSGPAFAAEGLGVNAITTSSVDEAQGALEMVHRKVYVLPEMPLNVEVGLVGDKILPPAPEMMLQVPVPAAGELPARVADVAQSV